MARDEFWLMDAARKSARTGYRCAADEPHVMRENSPIMTFFILNPINIKDD
jgi:hypothetical protein